MYEGVKVGLHAFLTWAVGGSEWLVSCFGCFTLEEMSFQLQVERRLVEAQDRSGAVVKGAISDSARNQTPGMQPVTGEILSDLLPLNSSNQNSIAPSITSHYID